MVTAEENVVEGGRYRNIMKHWKMSYQSTLKKKSEKYYKGCV